MIRCVTSKIHSGMPSLLTTELLIFFCKRHTDRQQLPEERLRPTEGMGDTRSGQWRDCHLLPQHLHKGLETLILGIEVLEVIHRLVVMPTKLAVRLL